MNKVDSDEIVSQAEKIVDTQFKPISQDNQAMENGERLLNEVVYKVLLVLKAETGLSDDEAKTVAYWAIATYGLEVLDCFPPLVLHGKPSTGKSTILKIVSQLVDADLISTTSEAAFRDKLVQNRIVLIEEGDKVDEDLILKGYSRQSGKVDINRQATSGI